MARASRRSNIAAMEGGADSDDDAPPVVRKRGTGARGGNAPPAPKGGGGGGHDSSDEEPIGSSYARSRKGAPEKSQKSRIEDDDYDDAVSTRRKGGTSAKPERSRRGAATDYEDEEMDEPPPAARGRREEDAAPSPRAKSKSRRELDRMDAGGDDEDIDASIQASMDAEAKSADDLPSTWGWVTSKFFNQDERILERWSNISIPNSSSTRSIEALERFKTLCLKNKDKWVRTGIAFEKRAQVWELFSQVRVYEGRLENPLNYYKSLIASSRNMSAKLKKDIRVDVSRTMQAHARFKTSQAQKELERILSAYGVRNPAVGYCQSMSHIVGFLMLFYSEENVFWFLCTIIDHYLPADFYAPSLLGVRVESEVFIFLLEDRCSKLYKHLKKYDIDLRMVCLKWFLCLFLLTTPFETTARIWDIFLLEGSWVLVNFGLGLLELHKDVLLKKTETSELLECLNSLGSDVHEAEPLIKKALDKFNVKEKEVVKLRNMFRPNLEKEYVSQLQNMEKRRAKEEKERRRMELERLKQENLEDALVEQGTSALKIPKNAFQFWSKFFPNSRPKKIMLHLKHNKPKVKPNNNGDDTGNSPNVGQGSARKKSRLNLKTHLIRGEEDTNGNGNGNDGGGGEDDGEAGGNDANGNANGISGSSPRQPNDEWVLSWDGSAKKAPSACRIPLNEVQVVLGCTAGVFATNSKVHDLYQGHDFLCVSFLFPPEPASQRLNHSLDVIFDSFQDLELWIKVLRRSNVLRIKDTVAVAPHDRPVPTEGIELAPTATAAASSSSGPHANNNNATTGGASSSNAAGGTSSVTPPPATTAAAAASASTPAPKEKAKPPATPAAKDKEKEKEPAASAPAAASAQSPSKEEDVETLDFEDFKSSRKKSKKKPPPIAVDDEEEDERPPPKRKSNKARNEEDEEEELDLRDL